MFACRRLCSRHVVSCTDQCRQQARLGEMTVTVAPKLFCRCRSLGEPFAGFVDALVRDGGSRA